MSIPLMLIPTDSQIEAARAREQEMREILTARNGRGHLRNSITEGEGTLAGFVGEELVRSHYNWLASEGAPDVFHYDVLDPLWLGRIDVKTKRCTSAPRPEYNCSIAATSIKQQCDYYAFVRVLNDLSRAWLLGFMPKRDFFSAGVAQFYARGDLDPASDRGWRFRWDCYNVPVSALITPPKPHEDFSRSFPFCPATEPDFSPHVFIEEARA